MKRRRGTELARQGPVPEPKWCTRPNPSEPDTQRCGIAERDSLVTSHVGTVAKLPTQLLVRKAMPRNSEQSGGPRNLDDGPTRLLPVLVVATGKTKAKS